MNQTVKGRFDCFGDDGNYHYLYTCSCGIVFRESCPEVSAPALCHGCYRGKRNGDRFRKVENSGRKGQHWTEAS